MFTRFPFSRALLGLGCLIAGLVVSPSRAADMLVATLPGEFSVDNKGAANYSIPLAIPPGRGGLQPKLSLNYNSQSGNGPLGVGWALSTGFPQAITRGRTILARDGIVHGPVHNTQDRLFLDGKRLILVSPPAVGLPVGQDPYWQVGNMYRTEVDSFVAVTALGENGATTGSEIVGFKLEQKDGTVLYFGKVDASSADAVRQFYGLSAVFSWALKRVEDRVGNALLFHYKHCINEKYNYKTGAVGRPSGEHLLVGIDYTSNVSAGVGATWGVRIKYTPDADQAGASPVRADSHAGYVAIGENEMIRRMTSVKAGPLAVGTVTPTGVYAFSYEQSPKTSRSRLFSVGCSMRDSPSAAWATTPPTTLGYRDDGGLQVPSAATVSSELVSPLRDPVLGARMVTGDFNGDGLQDKYYGGKVYLGNGAGFAPGVAWFSTNTDAYILRSGDIDGDGRSDLIWVDSDRVYAARSDGSSFTAFSGGSGYLLQNLGSASFQSYAFGEYNAAAASRVSIGDFNGDGRSDVLIHCSYTAETGNVAGIYVLLSTGTGLAAPERWGGIDTYDSLSVHYLGGFPMDWDSFRLVPNVTPIEPIVCDFNADGVDDYAYIARPITYFSEFACFETDVQVAICRPDFSGLSRLAKSSLYWQERFVSFQGVPQDEAPIVKVWAGDCNGDGYTDLLVLGEQGDGAGGFVRKFTLFPNRGSAFADGMVDCIDPEASNLDVSTYRAVDDYFYPRETSSVQTGGMFLQDVDGDGRSDFVCGLGESGGWRVNFGQASGFGAAQQLWSWNAGELSNLGDPFPSFYDESGISVQPIDLDGDGGLDWLLSSYNGYAIARNLGAKNDLLSTVTDGLGRTTSIEYKSTGDPSVYTPGAAASYPVRENRNAQIVVSDVYKDSGSTNTADRAHFSYQYSGNRLDLSGRGALGFHSFVTLDQQTKLFKYQFLAQSFPMTGLTAREQTYRYWEQGSTVNFRLINSHDNTVVFDEVSNGSGGKYGTVYPFISQATEYRWENSNTDAHFSWARTDARVKPSSADKPASAEGLFSEARPAGAHIAISAKSWFDNQSLTGEPQTTIPGGLFHANDRSTDWASAGVNKVYGSDEYKISGLGLPGNITHGNLKKLKTDFGDGFTETVETTYKTPVGSLTGLVDTVKTTVSGPGGSSEVAPLKSYTYATIGGRATPLVATEKVDAAASGVIGADARLTTTTTYLRDDRGRVIKTVVSGYDNPGGASAAVLGTLADNEDQLYHIGTIATVDSSFAGDFDDRWDLPKITRNAYPYLYATTTAYDPYLGLPISVKDVNGAETKTTYDALGRTVKVVDVLKGLESRSSIAWTDSDNASDWTKAQPVGLPSDDPFNGVAPNSGIENVKAIKAKSVYAIRSIATAQAPVTAYYDRLGRVIRTVKEGFGTVSTVTDTVYNTLGQTIAVSLPYNPDDSNTGPLWTKTTYDALGRVATVTAPNGTVTTNSYRGRITQVTVDAANLGGVDPAPQTNTTFVDAKGRTIKVWNADIAPVLTLIASNTPAATTSTTASIEYVLDGFGRMKETILNGQTQKITAKYDALGRQTELNDPDKGKWEYINNALGQVVYQKDANGTVTRSTFDRLGRPLSRQTTQTSGPVETADWYYYGKDTLDNLHTVTAASQGWIGAPQRETVHNDPKGTGGYVDPGSASVHYYDAKGRPALNLNQVDGKFFYTAHEYDQYSRPQAVRYFWRPAGHEDNVNTSGTGTPSATPYYWQDWGYTYNYDAPGGDSTKSKSYLLTMADSAGRIWWQADTTAGYDFLDRPVKVRKGNGHWTERTYRPTDGLLSAIKTGSTSSPTAIQNLTFSYDGLGNLTGRTGPASEAFGYDELNRLTHRNDIEVVAYKANGNIDWKEDVEGHKSTTYAYDTARPHAVKTAFGYTMTYDNNGNLATRTGGGHTWSTKWAGFDKPRWLADADSTKGTTKGSEFLYNANRSRVVHLEFDAMTGAGAAATPSHYVRKKVYGLGPQLEADYANTAATGAPTWALDKIRIYVPGPEGIAGTMEFNPRAPFGQAEQSLVYHYDHLGSIERITPYGSASTTYVLDDAGKQSRYSYDAWGQRRDPNDWSGKPTATADGGSDDAASRGFTGHEMLDDLGLVHMNGRIYDPLLGRFLSADKKITYPSQLRSYDRYAYVLNNPLSFTDPDGYDPVPPYFVQTQQAAFMAGHGEEWVAASHSTLPVIMEVLVNVGIGFTPVIGDLVGLKMDADDLNNPNAAWWEKALAGGDILLTVMSGSLMPNIGPEKRAAGIFIDEVKALEKETKAAARSTTIAADEAAGAGRALHEVTEAPVPQRVEVSSQVDGGSAGRAAPAADNYRGRYNAQRHAEGKLRLPDDYDAHHRIPQEYRGHKDLKGFDFDAPDNIQGVKGSRADVNTHQDITNDWAAFREANPNATGDAIRKFAQEIDERYEGHWFR